MAQATFRQLVRDPALLLVAGAALVLILTAPVYAVFHFGELAKVMIDTGLSTVLLAGLVIALLGPARAVAYELEDRTALTLLSKPVGRVDLVAGKYLGVMGAILVIHFPLAMMVLYVVRIAEVGDAPDLEVTRLPLLGVVLPRELVPLIVLGAAGVLVATVGAVLMRRGRAAWVYLVLTCAAAAGVIWGGGTCPWRMEVLGAAALIALEVAVVAAAAMAAAVRLGAVGTMAAGLGVMVAGHLRDLVGPGAFDGGVAGVVLMPLPGLEALGALEAAAAGVAVPGGYIAWAALYATMYATAGVLAGAAMLHGREVA